MCLVQSLSTACVQDEWNKYWRGSSFPWKLWNLYFTVWRNVTVVRCLYFYLEAFVVSALVTFRMQLLLTRKVKFGADVAVIVYPDTTGEITIPSLEEGKIECRKASADTVGLQLLTRTPASFQCVVHTGEEPWRCVTTVSWDVAGSFCCLDHVAKPSESSGLTFCWFASQRPDLQSTTGATWSCCCWRRATTSKMTSCARCFGMRCPETSSHGSVVAKCIGSDVFTWALFDNYLFLYSHAA